MLIAPNLSALDWLTHGFGQRDSIYPDDITTVKQIHSDIVVEAPDGGGDRFTEADALVARQPGLVVGVRTADCVPVLLADTRTHAVAAIHAGWRGTARSIVAATLREMSARYGTRPEDIHAAIGPSIGPCCYEVGLDVAQQFQKWTHPNNRQLDLQGINALQLAELGVVNVWKSGVCTFCERDLYYSYRREKEEAGRMLSFIGARQKNTSGGFPV
jgi:polyphenol oxidase